MELQHQFSTEYSGLISLRIDRLDLLAVQGTLKSLLHPPAPQFEKINSSALSLLCGPALHLHLTTGKTIALTLWIFVGKVMSLSFNTLPSFVTTFLPRSEHLLISQ